MEDNLSEKYNDPRADLFGIEREDILLGLKFYTTLEGRVGFVTYEDEQYIDLTLASGEETALSKDRFNYVSSSYTERQSFILEMSEDESYKSLMSEMFADSL